MNFQSRVFREGQNLKQREDIQHRLNKFYGPMKELRTESRRLFDVFAMDEKKYAGEHDGHFRTMTFLTEGKTLADTDKELLNLILSVGKMQLSLIEKEGWAVENSALTELLGNLGGHIRTLALANEHKLDGMAIKLESMVFPLEIDGALESETRRLLDRYNELLNNKANRLTTKLDNKELNTIGYYNDNAQDYFKETAYIDLADIYTELFNTKIPRGGMILDAGCGVGRDTRYFIKNGYKVFSFDASREMAYLCRQYPFAYCKVMSFEDVNNIEEFDAVWANASLIHVSEDKLPRILLRLVNSIKEGGVLYFSLKSGKGSAVDREGMLFLVEI